MCTLGGVNILLVYPLAQQKFRLSDSECFFITSATSRTIDY